MVRRPDLRCKSQSPELPGGAAAYTAPVAERMTVPSDVDPEDVLAAVTPARRAADTRAATALLTRVTGARPRVWGTSILGFGRTVYTTADGADHEWFALGLAGRKAAVTLYGLTYDDDGDLDLIERLGPVRRSPGCLYVSRWDALDHTVLEELVRRSWAANHRAD